MKDFNSHSFRESSDRWIPSKVVLQSHGRHALPLHCNTGHAGLLHGKYYILVCKIKSKRFSTGYSMLWTWPKKSPQTSKNLLLDSGDIHCARL